MFNSSSLNQKYEESSELVESLMLSNAEYNEIEPNPENNLEYYLIFEQDIQVYFSRLRHLNENILLTNLIRN